MPRLLINPGTSQQWEASLKPGPNTLGRSPACDIQIDHGSVSGTHCQMTLAGATVTVRDLGSTNGTFLNKGAVQETPLSPGQRLQLGGVEMELVLDGVAPRPSGAPVVVRLAVAAPAPAPSTGPIVPAAASSAAASTPPAVPRPVLRVTAPEQPPPPPQSSTPSIVVDDYAAEATAPALCKYHPKTLARYLCPQCQLNYCELCVSPRPGGTRTGKFCRRCSGECVALNVQLVREGADKENFFAALPGAFVYPFKGNGLTFLICGTLFLALLNFLGGFGGQLYILGGASFLLKLFATAFTFAYVQRVIQTAAQGLDEQAGWPDVSDFWQDVIVPCFQLICLALVCFGPLAAASYFLIAAASGAGVEPVHWVILIAALLAGLIYYPMAYLALAMYDSVAGLNPLVVIPAIFRAPLEYLTALFVAGFIVAVVAAQQYALQWLSIPVLSTLIAGALTLYSLTVLGRILGLLYFAKRQELGWFNLR